MSTFEIKPASRVGVIPWIDLYSESGCGKTYSSLLLARGIVGPTGKIGMVDTESGRGNLYADVIPGGYDVLPLDQPFTPERYMLALQEMVKARAQVVIVDSMSHAWEGIGGVCDMAAENEARSGKAGLHNWKTPKVEHQKMVQFLLRFPVPLICCVRAKHKTRQTKDERGKTVIVKDEHTSPIQAEDFIFEATAHAEILQDHSIRLTKCSHPDLAKCFPSQGPIKIEHGRLIAAWCQAPKGPGTSAPANGSERNDLLKTIRDMTAEIHGWTPALKAVGWTEVCKPKLAAWLIGELKIETPLDQQSPDELRETIKAIIIKLKP